MANRLKIQSVHKEFLIKRVINHVQSSSLACICHTGDLNYVQNAHVRTKLGAIDANFTQTRNSLTRVGLERAGMHALTPLCRGTSALASGPNEVQLAKTLLELNKELPNFFVLGAMLNRQRLLEYTDVERLAKLPPLDVVQAQMVSSMMPGSALQVPNVAAYLVSVLSAHVEAQGGAPGGGGGDA